MSITRINVVADPWDTFEVEENRSADGDTATITKVGLYDALRAMRPYPGDTLAGWEGFEVADCSLTKRPGGMGRLTINLHLEEVSGGSGGSFGLVSRKLALTWRQDDGGLMDGWHDTHGSSITVSNIQMWRNEPNATLRAAYQFNNPVLYGSNGIYSITYTVVQLTGLDLAIAMRIDAGQTGAMKFMPVVTVTQRHTKEPRLTPPPRIVTAAVLRTFYLRLRATSSNRARQRNIIPATEPGVGTAYQYMLTRSDAQEDDRGWQVVKEWLGSVPPTGKLGEAWGAGEAFDSVFYPAVSTSVNDDGCV